MCILLNGIPQNELANGVVPLPFGCEYHLRFRNKNNRNAVVKIYVDGENVSGEGYVVYANSHIDVKRHHDVDRSFKFVSLDSSDAVEHGKNGPNDNKTKGTIEARFFLEKERIKYHTLVPFQNPYSWCPSNPMLHHSNEQYRGTISFSANDPTVTNDSHVNYSGECVDKNFSSMLRSSMHGNTSNSTGKINTCSVQGLNQTNLNLEKLQDGCTVEGNQTGQVFSYIHMDLESDHTVVRIFLQGAELEKKKPKKDKKTKLKSDNQKLKNEIEQIKNLKDENERLKEELGRLKSV